MNEPKRHHYNPQFYLRRWAGPDGRVVRFHRPYDEVVVSRHFPGGIGFEEFLYSVEGQADAQILEKGFFQNIDNDAAPLLEKMCQLRPGLVILENAAFGSQERSEWVRFISSLSLRSPHSLSEIETVHQRSMRENMERIHGEAYRASKNPGDPDSAYDYLRQHGPEWLTTAHKFLLPELIDHAPVGNVLVNMIWAVLDLSGGPYSLLTSDRPYTTSHGLRDPQCVLRVPISPTRLFVAANHMARLNALARQAEKDTVRECNELVVRSAVQNVYGVGTAERLFVERVMRRRGEAPIPGVIVRT